MFYQGNGAGAAIYGFAAKGFAARPPRITYAHLYDYTVNHRRQAISSIIIDGYNLIGTQHRNLQQKREDLIRQLAAYRTLKGHDITIVFDGWKSGGQNQVQAVAGGVRVIYSRLGDKADDVIRTMIEQERKEWIVVSSDREIMDHAWKNSSVPVPSGKFMRCLEQAGNDPACAFESPEEDDSAHQQKGSPRKPSKKEKALMRVLSKL